MPHQMGRFTFPEIKRVIDGWVARDRAAKQRQQQQQ